MTGPRHLSSQSSLITQSVVLLEKKWCEGIDANDQNIRDNLIINLCDIQDIQSVELEWRGTTRGEQGLSRIDCHNRRSVVMIEPVV